MIQLSFRKQTAMSCLCILVVGTLLFGCSKKEESPALSQVQSEEIDLVEQSVELIKEGEIARAINGLKAAIYLDPNNSEARLMLGQLFVRMEKHELAANQLFSVIQIDPQKAQAHFLLAECYSLLGNRAKAIESLKNSCSIFRENRDDENFKRAVAILQDLMEREEASQKL